MESANRAQGSRSLVHAAYTKTEPRASRRNRTRTRRPLSFRKKVIQQHLEQVVIEHAWPRDRIAAKAGGQYQGRGALNRKGTTLLHIAIDLVLHGRVLHQPGKFRALGGREDALDGLA